MTNKRTEKANIKAVHLYSTFTAAVILMFIPHMLVSTFGLCLLVAVLVVAYVMRAREEEKSLLENHATYVIRTIWIWSLFFTIGIIIAIPWFWYTGDHTVVHFLKDRIYSGSMLSEQELMSAMREYAHQNMQLMISIATVTIGPCIVYLVYRLAKGLSRALKGYRIADPRSWF